jgi:hypothetical protein
LRHRCRSALGLGGGGTHSESSTYLTAPEWATVTVDNGPRVGAYTFYLSGSAVGNELIGEVDVAFESEVIKRGTECMGAWRSDKDE